MRNGRLWHWIGVGLVALSVVAGTYGPSVGMPLYADDFQVLWAVRALDGWDAFVATHSSFSFYRPLQNIVLAPALSATPPFTPPVHLLQIALHVVLAALTVGAGRRIGMGMRASLVAGAFVLVSQAAVAAVLGNDTLSQVASTVLGGAGLWAIDVAMQARATAPGREAGWRDQRAWGAHGSGALLLCASLFFKETGAAFGLLAALRVLWAVGRCEASVRARLREGLVWTLPLVVTAGVYASFRALAVGLSTPGGDIYAVEMGANVPVNLALLSGSVAAVAPTSALFEWGATGRVSWLTASAVATIGAWAPVAYGVWQKRRGQVALLSGAALLCLFPAALLMHVSELYAYSMLPPVALLVGWGGQEAWQMASKARRPRVQQAVVAAGIALLLIGNAGSARFKAGEMETSARRTSDLIDVVSVWVEAAPPDATIRLQSVHDATAYSVFRMPGWRGLHFAERWVQHRAQRSDVELHIIDAAASTSLDVTAEGPVETLWLCTPYATQVVRTREACTP